MMEIANERLGLPSASSLETDALCPGRQQLLATLPPAIDLPDSDAQFGNRIHKARETLDSSFLSDEEREVYERGLRSERRIVEQWCADHGFAIEDAMEMPRELRLWLHWPDTAEPAASGKLDAHYKVTQQGLARGGATFVLIVDWKSLWCKNLTPAERNWQGRLQAVLAAREYDAHNVRMAFNKAMFGKGDVVEYSATDLQFAEQSILQAVWETRQPNAPRRAGPHCRYCPGKDCCPEAGAYTLLPSVLANRAVEKPDIDAAVQRMTPADLRRIFGALGTIEKIGSAVKARLKGMSDEQLQELGIRRVEGRKLDKIVKVREAFEALKGFGISENELWQALQFGKDDLVKAIMRDQGWSADATKGWLWEQFLTEFMEKKRAQPSLELI